MPRSIILIRHAESEHHVKRLSGGWTDTPITERGHRQARLLAERLKDELGETPVRLFTSDLLRTRETAGHIAAALAVEPVPDARLREFNNGEAANLTIDEALRRFPQPPGPWGADYRGFPGGETWRELYTRAAAFLADLPDDGRLPLVVTHSGTTIGLVAGWLGLPAETTHQIGFSAHVTGVTVLQRDDHGYSRIERLNDIAHLAGSEGHVPLSAAFG